MQTDEEIKIGVAHMMNHWTKCEVNEEIDDLVYPLLNDEQKKEYHRLTSFRRLIEDCNDNGVLFSWQIVDERGWACEDSYKIFPELADLRKKRKESKK